MSTSEGCAQRSWVVERLPWPRNKTRVYIPKRQAMLGVFVLCSNMWCFISNITAQYPQESNFIFWGYAWSMLFLKQYPQELIFASWGYAWNMTFLKQYPQESNFISWGYSWSILFLKQYPQESNFISWGYIQEKSSLIIIKNIPPRINSHILGVHIKQSINKTIPPRIIFRLLGVQLKTRSHKCIHPREAF